MKLVNLFFFILTLIFVSSSIKADKSLLTIEWDDVEGAISYEIKVVKINKEGSSNSPLKFETEKPIWKAKLNPGHYKMFIRTFDSRKVPGPWGDPQEFTVKPPPINLVKPNNLWQQTSSEDQLEVNFQWENYEKARYYKLTIINLENNKSETFKSQSTESTQTLKNGFKYQWYVEVVSDDEIIGKPSATRDFVLIKPKPIKNKENDLAKKKAKEEDNKKQAKKETKKTKIDDTKERLESFEHLNSWYIKGSGSLAIVDYLNHYYENVNNGSQFTTVGAHALMTVGFQRFMSHWGVEARFGLFGITVSEDNFMYPDLTLRGFGRLFWGSKRFNFYAGIQHKELPEFVGSSSNGLQNTNFIEQLGLNLAFRFEYPMLKKWMLAFDYELFSTIDGSSSNGNSLNPKQSQRMSFELNHKLWQHVRTSLGLVLTNDQAEYGSESNVNFTDQNNFIEFSTFEFLMGIEISF